jgi:hypothetical protein
MKRILHVGMGPLGVRIVQDLHEREVGHVVAVRPGIRPAPPGGGEAAGGFQQAHQQGGKQGEANHAVAERY